MRVALSRKYHRVNRYEIGECYGTVQREREVSKLCGTV